jgi:hypothetical protein
MDPPKLDPGFFRMKEIAEEAINSIASRERAAQGADNSKERSGKAIQLAVSQNNIGHGSELTAVNNAVARGARIKLELMMSDFTTAQQVGYVGDDGANKMMDLHAMDFALIGKVGIKAGTGTGLSQDGKVQYLGNLKAEGFISAEESADAARPSFAKRLGLKPNPFEQYVSRCIDAWLEGPPADDPTPDPMTGAPKPGWADQYRAWKTAQDQYKQAQAQFQQQQEQQQLAIQNQAIVEAGPPQPLGPEAQNEQAGVQFAQARIALSLNPLSPNPTPPVPPQVPKPWTPFQMRPNDTEPGLSAIWMRKLSHTMSSVDYDRFGPEWTDVFNEQYTLCRQAAAMASTTPGVPQQTPAAGHPQKSAQPAGAQQPTQPAQPTQPSTPTPPQAVGAR